MAMISVSSNAHEVSRFFVASAAKLKIFGGVAADVMAESRKVALLGALAQEAPRGTGELAESFSADMLHTARVGTMVRIQSSAAHAGFVLHGTGVYFDGGGHTAWDVDKLQRFAVNGGVIFAMHTHHEGQKPNDFVGRALERAAPSIALTMDALSKRLSAVFIR